MRDVWRASLPWGQGAKIEDKFDRADSTTSAGGDWTATSATWGISSERLYSVTDTDGNLLTQDPDIQDGIVQAIVRGTLASGTVYRSPSLCFHIREDYLGAIDTNNMLLVRLLGGVVDLRKVDGGTESSLTTATLTTSDGVDYLLRVIYTGSLIRVFVDDIELITYNLLGLNQKYLTFPRVGVRWDKAGSPATAARVYDYRAYKLTQAYTDHHDWGQSADLRDLSFGLIGAYNGLWNSALLEVEGGAPLSELGADTTFGTLASDTTAALEVQTTDPAFRLLMEYAKAELYDLMSEPAWNPDPASRADYSRMADKAANSATMLRDKLRMPKPQRPLMYAY